MWLEDSISWWSGFIILLFWLDYNSHLLMSLHYHFSCHQCLQQPLPCGLPWWGSMSRQDAVSAAWPANHWRCSRQRRTQCRRQHQSELNREYVLDIFHTCNHRKFKIFPEQRTFLIPCDNPDQGEECKYGITSCLRTLMDKYKYVWVV